MIKHTGRIALFLCLLTTFLSSCTHQGPQKLNPPQVTAVNPTVKDVPITQDFVGEVYGASDIPIRARVDGFLEEIRFEEGGTVKKGQLLYIIDAAPYNEKVAGAQGELAEAKTALVQADNDLERIKPLAEINAVSASDLDAAIAARNAAKSRLAAAQANLNANTITRDYTEILAPISGVIGKSQAKIGEYVGTFPNPVILNTISRMDSVLVEFFLVEEDYLRLFRMIQAEIRDSSADSPVRRGARFPLQLLLADNSVFDQEGRIKFINREVDPTTGAILVQAEFPNPDKLLRPGQFAKIRAVMQVHKNAILIPQRAVIETQGNFTVKAINDSSKVETRPIKVASSYKDYYVVKEGLTISDKIVLDGLQQAREGIIVEPEIVEFKSQAEAQ